MNRIKIIDRRIFESRPRRPTYIRIILQQINGGQKIYWDRSKSSLERTRRFSFFVPAIMDLATNRLKLTVSRTNRKKNHVFMIRLFVCALCIGIIDGRGAGTLLSQDGRS